MVRGLKARVAEEGPLLWGRKWALLMGRGWLIGRTVRRQVTLKLLIKWRLRCLPLVLSS